MFKLMGFEPLNSGVQIIRFTNRATTSASPLELSYGRVK